MNSRIRVGDKNFDDMSDNALCALTTIMPLLPFSLSTLNRWVDVGKFPKPVMSRPNRYWRVGEVRSFLKGEWPTEHASKAA